MPSREARGAALHVVLRSVIKHVVECCKAYVAYRRVRLGVDTSVQELLTGEALKLRHKLSVMCPTNTKFVPEIVAAIGKLAHENRVCAALEPASTARSVRALGPAN